MAQTATCVNCRTLFQPRGRRPKCPSCGEPYEEFEPLPPLPVRFAVKDEELEAPEFPREKRDQETAPLHEFAAAIAVVLGFGILILGAVLASPPVFIAGLVLICASVLVYAAVRFGGSLARGRFPRRPWFPP